MQVDRLGGRTLAETGMFAGGECLPASVRALLTANDRGDGAQQAGLLAGRLQQRAHEEGGRRLAVRASDPHDAQRRGRIAEEAARHRPHRRAHRGNKDLGHAQAQRPLHDKRDGAVRDRPRGEVVAVAAEAGDAEEQHAGPHRAAVVCEPGNLDVRSRLAHGTDARDQLAKRHKSSPSDSTLLV